MAHRIDLESEGWTLRASGDSAVTPPTLGSRTVPATVPGCVHTDLLDAGVIGDINAGSNEDAAAWVSLADWEYQRSFGVSESLLSNDEVDLVFDEGLDTLAEVWLNGIQIGNAANEFVPHRWSVREVLRPGNNELRVVFRSALSHIRREAERLGPRPVNGDWDPFIFIRKCASNFGWDWGPKVATCGIGGGVRLHGWSVARLESPRVLVNAVPADSQAGASWDIELHTGIVWSTRAAGDGHVTLEATFTPADDQTRPITSRVRLGRETNHAKISLRAQSGARWWPRGYGEATLHDIAWELGVEISQRVLEVGSRRIGLRTTGLRTSRDDGAPAFAVNVNGRDVLCVGANWIPEGLWPRDRTRARVRERLLQFARAGMNMLRIWGGGRYEPDWFYDLCDELGIAVWQDFMFTCACYSEEQPIWSQVEREASHQIARLSWHPSVVIWCGGNECVWAHANWGFKEKLSANQTWGRAYWFEMLPRLMANLDPTRPYWPNSPWSGSTTIAPNEVEPGDRHTWDIDLISDKPPAPLFCSEFGQQSLPTLETLRETFHAAELKLGAAWLEKRQRGPGGNARWFNEPFAKHELLAELEGDSAEDAFLAWHSAGHELQSRALTGYISWLLANRERCKGILIWQLNDAWVGPSWSLIDAAGRPKPAYFAVQRLLATIEWPVPPTLPI